MNKRLVRYLLIILVCFICDDLLKYYLPQSFLNKGITIIPYLGLIMFTLLNNTIDEDMRYPFALICGGFYSLIYGNSLLMYMLLFVVFAFVGRLYTKKSKFTYFEALLFVVLTIFTQEVVIYWLMWMTKVTKLFIVTYMLNRLLPTVIFNIIGYNLVYYIHDKLKIEGDNNVYFGKRS